MWTYVFERDGQWYEVTYLIAEAHDEIPPMALEYLETLKTEAAR